jgi:hypothetical protein
MKQVRIAELKARLSEYLRGNLFLKDRHKIDLKKTYTMAMRK